MFDFIARQFRKVNWPDFLFFLAILLLFFVSGACGLLYQVVWTRRLVLLFGTTSYAVSTVLSIFFIGLGAGSLWGGRLADRVSRPLVVYGLFEIIIGAWALLFIGLIDGGEALVVSILRHWASSRIAAIGLRAALSLIFLIVPVFLMGATLPLLSKFVSGASTRRGGRIGALYSVNTFGAVAGCALAGFLVLPSLGYIRTTFLGAAANGVIGVLAIFLAKKTLVPKFAPSVLVPKFPFGNARVPEAVLPAPGKAELLEQERSQMEIWERGKRAASGIVLVCFALSGFCALALEVLWTRLLTMIFLGTTYAFTTMLTTLLCGIAAGSAVASLFIDKRRRPVLIFAGIEMAIGVSCVLMLPVFAGLPGRLHEMQVNAGYNWAGLIQAKFWLSFLVLFLPTFLFGMTFPVVVRVMTAERNRLGRDIGVLYSANTFGGVLGAAVGGFVLIPLVGAQGGIWVLAGLLLFSGLLLALASEGRWFIRAATALAGIGLFAAAWHLAPGNMSEKLAAGYIPADHRIIHFREGVEGAVAVSEPKDNATKSDRVLWINGVQATASIEKGVKMNRFEGVLPLLFDRDPRRVLFMCFGSGITAGTLGLYDFDRIDAVEISRDVLDAAPFFGADNFNVTANPKLRFIVDDGRNYLLTTPEKYDVITFEPMPLALAGVSTFYTQEYYRLCLGHLTPGGLVSQWVPLHSLNPQLVHDLIGTFTSVFPQYCAWFVNADLFIVGSNQPLYIDYERASRRLASPPIHAALDAVGLKDVAEVLTCFFMNKSGIDAYAKGAVPMTDDRPWAEFIAPKLMYDRTVDKTLAELTPFFASPTTALAPNAVLGEAGRALDRRHQAKVKDLDGLKTYYGGSFGSEPEKSFKAALELDPNDFTARYYLGEIITARVKTFVQWREPEKAIAALTDALKYAPSLAQMHLMLADIYFDQGQPDLAGRSYREYLSLGGQEARATARAAAAQSKP